MSDKKYKINKFKENIIGLVAAVIVSVIIVSVIWFFFSLSRGIGTSNEPTMSDGTILIGVRHFYTIRRDDFVRAEPEKLNGKAIVKRVVAIGGDHVEVRNGVLYINDMEDLLDPDYYYDTDLNLTVPEGSYFLLGDNRGDSRDSRELGCISGEEIESKIIWYFSR